MKTKPLSNLIKKELRTPAHAKLYLEVALESGDPIDFVLALRDVVEHFGGIAALSKKKKLSRTSLYKTLSRNGNPEFHTTVEILDAIGFKFKIGSKNEKRAS